VNAGELHLLSGEGGGRPGPRGGEGVAVPSGSIVFDGAQRWSVSTARGTGALVTIGCLQVRVVDRTALDIHVRAWSEAMDMAVQAFPTSAVPFSRMVSNARFNDLDRGLGVWQPIEDDGPRRPGPELSL
jgi:hypothetical protein